MPMGQCANMPMGQCANIIYNLQLRIKDESLIENSSGHCQVLIKWKKRVL
jgi:hypothetical protein